MLVEGRHEYCANYQTRQQVADHQLGVEKVPLLKALARRAEKRARANLRCQDRGENRPPRNRAPAKSEFRDILVSTAEINADRYDDPEIQSDDNEIHYKCGHVRKTKERGKRSKP